MVAMYSRIVEEKHLNVWQCQMPTINESKIRVQGWLLYYSFTFSIGLKRFKIKVGGNDELGMKTQLCTRIKGALFHQ